MQTSTPTFRNLLLMWFPVGQELPRGYLMDTSEEALLIQDWLKLKMIRSRLDLKNLHWQFWQRSFIFLKSITHHRQTLLTCLVLISSSLMLSFTASRC